MRLWHGCLDYLLPQHCVECGQRLLDGRYRFCDFCLADLPYHEQGCLTCGRPLAAELDFCGRCLLHPPEFDACFCAFRYVHPIDQLIHQFKYRGRPALARVLGELMADEILERRVELPQLLIPVPLHRRSLSQRGYNQSWELAQALGGKLGIPVNNRLIVKHRWSKRQVELSWKARLSNLRGSFSLKQRPAVKHIAIVDDVVTSGSTASEISKILKRNGVDYVQIWGIAHTVRP